MDILSFDEYFYEVWDNVPVSILSEHAFDRNILLVQEITFEYWNIYKNTCTVNEYEHVISEMDVMRCAKLMCILFKSLKQIGFKF